MKALSVQEENKYLRTHHLIELANYCAKFDPLFSDNKFINHLKIFDDFREVGRYGAESVYDPYARKEKHLEISGVSMWRVDYIKILDEIVSKIRGKLNHTKIGFGDSLKAILEDNKKAFLVSSWQLPISLRDILVNGNDFFTKTK